MTAIRICLTTCPDAACAEHLGGLMLQQGLIACAHIVPGITALYRWKGADCRASEVQLWLKTCASQLGAVEALLLREHHYDTPAFIALAADHVTPGYALWLEQQCGQGTTP